MPKLQEKSNGVKILAIESSCDDSGIAILEYDNKDSQPKVLANLVSSQIKVHAKWGGVVPMLAKREHQRNLPPLLKKALEESGLLKNSKFETLNSKQTQNLKFKIKIPARLASQPACQAERGGQGESVAGRQTLKEILKREPELLKKLLPFLKKYQKPDVDYIAVTSGPGLEPALWVGINLAKALSFVWDLPILPINHIEGHITANSANDGISGMTNDKLLMTKNFPAICLVVSGGHTQLVLIKKLGEYEIIGETRDDAAGEAFDKVAKMLNLGYPGGPTISRLAEKWNNNLITRSLDHSITKFSAPFLFPRPMMNSGDFDFSFSGLKTAVLYTLQKMTKAQIKKSTSAIAAAFQEAVIDVLTKKTVNSAKKYETKSIWLSGGVAANQALRQSLDQTAQENNLTFLVPPNTYCADNAGMIALAAFYQLKQNRAKKISWQDLKAEPNLRIS